MGLDARADAGRDDDGFVRVERWIDATPETVFSFFCDPGRWLSWQGSRPRSTRVRAGRSA